MTSARSARPLTSVRSWDETRDLVASFQMNRPVFYIGDWNHHLDEFGDVYRSNVQFNAFEFCFFGSAVRWLGSRQPTHGYADVYLDGQLESTVNSYAPRPTADVVKFERYGLPTDRLHKLRVVVRRQRDPEATDCYQDVSRLEAEEPVCYPVEMARQRDAEYAIIRSGRKDHAPPDSWRRITAPARVPGAGVHLAEGPFRTAFDRNIAYLRHCLDSPTYCDGEGWTTWLPASNHGRMLAGTANTLRWDELEDFRTFVGDTVAAINDRARPDGYYDYYPEEESYALLSGANSERKNYDRVFWTRGLLAAGRLGYDAAYTTLRRMYDWFNASPYRSDLLIGGNATNGFPGGPLMFLSPVGRPEDLITTLKYYDQDYWMAQLANAEPLAFTYYPGERPHCYDLLGLEAMVDEYEATGDPKYLDAVRGGWHAYRENFKHPGGTTTIMEQYPVTPPKSLFVTTTRTGEACGSVFWIDINSKLLQLQPGTDAYAAEIEESLFNGMLAVQDDRGYIRYHNMLSARKHEPGCRNTCCEVSSVGLIARVPELVYSLAEDGIYVNQFIASRLDWQHDGVETRIELITGFPFDPEVSLRFGVQTESTFSVHLRIPLWAGETEVWVNDDLFTVGVAGSYLQLTRLWRNGDVIRLALRMSYRTVEYEGVEQAPGNLSRHALLYGPLLMALVGGQDELPHLPLQVGELLERLSPEPDHSLTATVEGYPGYRYVPYWLVGDELFNCLPVIDVAQDQDGARCRGSN
jgi:hypothetical protein